MGGSTVHMVAVLTGCRKALIDTGLAISFLLQNCAIKA